VDANDANARCDTPCPTGGGCPVGEACFLKTSCTENQISSPETPNGDMTGSTGIERVEETLEAARDAFDDNLFLYETPLGDWLPSSVYRFEGFFEGFRVMHQVGVAGKKIYTGGDCDHCHMYGLVNVAAFLAQAMKETIRYDACDENSWDRVGDLLMYPLSNACGQLGQSYQDYHCSEEEAHMECVVDPEMTITAVTHAKWYGAPGPLKCGPKSLYPQTGYWDYAYECNNPWAIPPETCTEYEGQQAGKAINDVPYPNAAGRTDIEGCCWWGRGVIQTSGICNFGKLNFYLGKRAFLEGRESRYPDIDFCRDPEAICTSEEHEELKWIAGFFYWVDQVQPYNQGGWSYMDELHKFVENGLEGEEFINSVSGIVNRGCHNPPCGTGELDGGPERAENFFKILKELEFSFVNVYVTPQPTSLPPSPPPSLSPITLAPVALPTEVSFVCGDQTDPVATSEGVDVTFDYEVHSDLDTKMREALRDVKESILSDIAVNLGCYEVPSASGRKLQDSMGNIVRLEASRTDLPDPGAAGCIMEVTNNEPTSCTPTRGEFTIYAESGSSEASLNATTDYLKSLIQSGMESGRYESELVVKVVYVGDRQLSLETLYPKPLPQQVIVKETPPRDNSALKIALYCLAVACGLLICLLCVLIPSARKKKHQNHDEEMALADYMRSPNTALHRQPPILHQQQPQQRPLPPRRGHDPLKPPNPYSNNVLLENGTTSESDESADMQLLARGSNFTNRPPPPPPPHRGQRRASFPPPVGTIGATGQFYLQNDAAPQDEPRTRAPDPTQVIYDDLMESSFHESGRKMNYRLNNTGVESVDSGSFGGDAESYNDGEYKPTGGDFRRRSIGSNDSFDLNDKPKRKSKKKSSTKKSKSSTSKKRHKKRVENAKDNYFEGYEGQLGNDFARCEQRQKRVSRDRPPSNRRSQE